MWDKRAYHYPLWRFLRFRDPDLEVAYRRTAQQWALPTYRVYCVISLAIAIRGALVAPWDFSQPQIWLQVTAATSTTLLLAASFVLAPLRRRVVAVHACTAMLLSVHYAAVAYLSATGYPYTEMGRAMGKLQTLLTGQLGEPYLHTVDSYVESRWGFDATMKYIILPSCAHWFTLVLAGLNECTVVAYVFICCMMCGAVPVVPYLTREYAVAVVFAAVMLAFATFCITVVLEKVHRASFLAERLLTQELQASQMADSVLNHTLKNTLADVAANMEIFLAGRAPPSVLEDSIVCLRRGIQGCKQRQLYVTLASGKYVPAVNLVDLGDFGQQLAAGRAISGSFWNATVFVDATLVNLIVENAIANAFKHGRPGDPAVTFSISRQRDLDLPLEYARVVFQVTNAANPATPPLTPEAVGRLFQGRVQLRPDAPTPTLSDGIGLAHCLLAAKAGGIDISLKQRDGLVVFSAAVQCKMGSHQLALSDPPGQLQDRAMLFPSGLRFYCIDDSACALRLVEFYLNRWCQPATVQCFGAKEEDAMEFVDLAAVNADVVILDQHLVYGRATYHGTDLARRLLAQGFAGLICIRSGDDTEEDQQRYLASGA
eukprot:EG_transcript_7130